MVKNTDLNGWCGQWDARQVPFRIGVSASSPNLVIKAYKAYNVKPQHISLQPMSLFFKKKTLFSLVR